MHRNILVHFLLVLLIVPTVVYGGYGEGSYYSESSYYGQSTYYSQNTYYSQSSYSGGESYEVLLSSGTSWTVPTGVSSIKVWVIGGGGGGAGSPASDATSGGGGGAGGVAYKTYPVSDGLVATYSIGSAGSAGSGSNNGGDGGTSTFTINGSTVTATGGQGGRYNSTTNATGGTGSGGDGASTGGVGKGESGDTGGGYGGAIGGGTGIDNGTTGGTGAQSINVSSLQTAVVDAGQSWTSGGAGGAAGSPGSANANHGGVATGFGSGGGGAGYYGGNGGAGRLGGGGGGAAGYSAVQTGGAGGQGIVVISFTSDPLPGTPGTPTFSSVSYTSMRVSWTAATGATSYKVERCTGAGCSSFSEVASGVTTLYFDDSELTNGTTYRYRVRGTNTAGDGSYSGIGSQATNACSSGGNGGNVGGFAWSDTIGWISFNSGNDTCTSVTYGVSIDEDGDWEGYAWSENIGWIQFGGLSSFPSGEGTVSANAKMVGDELQGWARALAYSGGEAGGWDGWISLSGAGYGPTLLDGIFSGYAWGSDIVGWVDFSPAIGGIVIDEPVTTDFSPCETTYQCNDATHYDNVCTPSVNENTACEGGLICAAGAVPCIPPGDPTGELLLSPQLVPTGNTTEVSWSVVDTSSCRVFGDNGDEWFGSGSGLETSSSIIETTMFTLECANAFGEATTTIDVAYAVVVPTWVER